MSYSYPWKTEPFDHQREVLNETWDKNEFGLFWEQGTGKTKAAIDNMARLYLAGEIEGGLVIAPKGVHRNWVVDELPAHLPDVVAENSRAMYYTNASAKTAWHRERLEGILDHRDGFTLLALPYDSYLLENAKKAMWAYMIRRRGRVMLINDESKRIKSPGAKRTKAAIAAGRHVHYRRILEGTPVANSPFDIYSQFRFLDEGFWRREMGIETFAAFKAHFGDFKTTYVSGGRAQDVLREYKNLHELQSIVDRMSSRVRKEDVLDLPPKLYQRRYVELSPKQRSLYEQLKNDFVTWLDSGDEVTTELAITRLLKIQQVVNGWVKTDHGDIVDLDTSRVDALVSWAEDVLGQGIIWCRFKHDIEVVTKGLTRAGISWVKYDGTCSDEARGHAIDSFQKRGDAKFFVATEAGSEGLTLIAADQVAYYSNSFKLSTRLHSEDRCHRHGQTRPVTYTDFMASDTVDEHVAKALQNKLDVSRIIMQDEFREWF